MPTAKNSGRSIEGSPLLNNSAQNPPANSTIHPDRLDKTRFSEIKEMESEGSSFRVIIYVLIVIAVGVGLALLVRQLIANQNTTPQTEATDNTTQPPPATTQTAFMVNKGVQLDSLATNVAENEDYVDSTLVSLGSAGAQMDSVELTEIEYTDYTTFSRLVFDLSTDEAKLPKTNLTYDPNKLSLSVEFVGIENIHEDLKQDVTISSLVKDVRFDEVNNKFIVFLKEKAKYRAFASQDNLVLDFKTVKALETPVAEEDEPEEEPATTPTAPTTPPATNTGTTPPSTDTSKPAAPHYENSFSQEKQYVSSKVNTNSISFNNYYVWDEGSFFEFSWAEEGKLGDDYVPNATAYLETVDSINYLVVEVENLKAANLQNGLSADQVASKAGITMAGANFVRIDLKSFDAATGKAVYRIELKKKANFQLLTQKTYNEKTQILSIQIKD